MQTGTPIFDRFACYGCNLSYINYQLTYSDSYRRVHYTLYVKRDGAIYFPVNRDLIFFYS